MIKHEGGKWKLFSKDGSKLLGTHDTEADAAAQERAIEAAKHRAAEDVTLRDIHLRTAGIAPRTEKLNGEEHLVVPVVALMEGVIHAVNASEPEFVPAARLAAAAQSWNGRPLVLGHPVRNGVQISANSPEVLEAQGFGWIYQSKMNGSKLGMEAWVNPRRLEALGQHDTLARIRRGEPIEVSVGAFVKALSNGGTYKGKAYRAEWGDITGDHLAFLPNGRGACSLEMGCGACRAAEAGPVVYEITEDGMRMAAWSEDDHPRDDHGKFSGGGGGGSEHHDPDRLSLTGSPRSIEAHDQAAKMHSGAAQYHATMAKNGGGDSEKRLGYKASIDAHATSLHSGGAAHELSTKAAAAAEAGDHAKAAELHAQAAQMHNAVVKTGVTTEPNYDKPLPAHYEGRNSPSTGKYSPSVLQKPELMKSKEPFSSMTRAEHKAASEHFVRLADKAHADQMSAIHAGNAAHGDHGPLISGGHRDHWPEAAKNAVRGPAHARTKYEDAAKAHRRASRFTSLRAAEGKSLRDRFSALIKAFRTAAPYDTPEQAQSEEDAELIGYQTLRTHLDGIESSLSEASDLTDDLIADETEDPTQTPSQEEAEEEIEKARCAAIVSLLGSIASQAQSAMACCLARTYRDLPAPSDPRYMEAVDALNLGIDTRMLAMKKMEDCPTCKGTGQVDGNPCEACDGEGQYKAAENHNDGGDPANSQETTMTKEERQTMITALTACPCSGFTANSIKTLEAMDDATLTAIKAAADANTKAHGDLKAAQEKATTLEGRVVALESKTLTEEDALKMFPSIKALVDGARAAEQARKDDLVTSLKTLQTVYTEEKLKVMSVAQLEDVAALVGANVPQSDFSMARPRVAEEKNAFTPPNGYEAGLKALASKQ